MKPASNLVPDVAAPTAQESRFLFYSHDGLGLGHTRRNLAIAAALTGLSPRASVLLTTGTDDAYRLGLPPRVEILKLPGLRKTANDRYLSRRLPENTEQVRRLRASLLEAAVRSFEPAVVLVDKHPFGARGEFRAGLEAVKEAGGRVVLGLRDILDEAAVVRREWAAYQLQDAIAAFHDRVLIYGEQSVFDPMAAYGLSEAVRGRARYCGYVVSRDDDTSEGAESLMLPVATEGRPVVLATAGGGEDGAWLLGNFLRAAVGAPWSSVAIAGPMTPEGDLKSLRAMASAASASFHRFIPRLPALFGGVSALVCMGGYNTLGEALSHAMPVVCVPRVVPRTEQRMRARAFQRLGLLEWIEPADLSPAKLRAALAVALSTPRAALRTRVAAALGFDGAPRAAEELLALARAGVPGGRTMPMELTTTDLP